MPSLFTNLDVWISGTARTSLDVLVSGSVRTDLQLMVAERHMLDTDLDIQIVTTPPHPQRVSVRMDMAILVEPTSTDGIDVEAYFDRFPVYLLPDTFRISCRVDVLVG